MNYQELVAARKRAIAERDGLSSKAQAILTQETISAEDDAKVQAFTADVARVGNRIALLDGQITDALNAPPVVDPSTAPDMELENDPIHTRPAHGRKGPYASIGEQAMDVHRAGVSGDSAARERLMNGVLHGIKGVEYLAASGQNIARDSEGGFLVQQDFASEIWQRMSSGGQILSRVQPLPLTPPANGIDLPGVDELSRANGSRWGGIRAYHVEEAGTITPSKQTYYKVSLKLKKIAALTYASDEMLQHVALMTRMLTQGMGDELRFVIEDDIFEGDGAGKPWGVLTAAAAVQISKETNQAAATVLHDNLKKMWARMPASSRANAAWFINQDVEPALDDLAKVIGTSGVEPNYVTYGPDGVLRIKGRPVVSIEYASTLGTVGDITLVDFTQYSFIASAIRQDTSMHFKFDTDEQAFRAIVRVDGALRWKSALAPFKGSASQSPVVKLQTR